MTYLTRLPCLPIARPNRARYPRNRPPNKSSRPGSISRRGASQICVSVYRPWSLRLLPAQLRPRIRTVSSWASSILCAATPTRLLIHFETYGALWSLVWIFKDTPMYLSNIVTCLRVTQQGGACTYRDPPFWRTGVVVAFRLVQISRIQKAAARINEGSVQHLLHVYALVPNIKMFLQSVITAL